MTIELQNEITALLRNINILFHGGWYAIMLMVLIFLGKIFLSVIANLYYKIINWIWYKRIIMRHDDSRPIFPTHLVPKKWNNRCRQWIKYKDSVNELTWWERKVLLHKE